MENPIRIDDFGGTTIFGNIHMVSVTARVIKGKGNTCKLVPPPWELTYPPKIDVWKMKCPETQLMTDQPTHPNVPQKLGLINHWFLLTRCC